MYEALSAKTTAVWRDWVDLAEAHADFAETYVTMAGQKNLGIQQRRQNRSQAVAELERAREIYARQRDKGVLPPTEIKRLDEISTELARCRQLSLP